MVSDSPRITLRHLPMPAKLVIALFLCSVGLGYFSAMVQLHQKHSKKEGEPLPTPDDVVAVFAGLEKYDPNTPPPCSRVDTILNGDRQAADVSKDNMAPAFFAKSKGWQANLNSRSRDTASLMAERTGELEAMLAWVRSKADDKKKAYETDQFTRPAEIKAQSITKEFLNDDGSVKIKKLVTDRCIVCHKETAPVLTTFTELEPLVTPPSLELIKGKYVRSSRQTTIDKLTQSTHAHLLTFSVLFGMTGLIFSFTSYWVGLRCLIGPIVLMAQVADISCWWLARLPEMGVYFALAIMGTGAVVGLGLAAQITLSLLNMFGKNGTALIVIVLILGAVLVGYVGLKVVQPALDEEKQAVQKAKEKADSTKKTDVKANDPVVSHLEQLIMGEWEGKIQFNGKGTMAPAFFNKESEFKRIMKDNPPADKQAKLIAEREGERLALQAWIRLPNADREKAYEADGMQLPKDRVGKPITPEYLADGKVKVRKIIEDRCTNCHSVGGEQQDYPLEKYSELLKYLGPRKQ